MPAKNKAAAITPYSSPRERFQASQSLIKGHQDLVDNDAFDIGADVALAQFIRNTTHGIKDMNTAAAAGWVIQGAVDFLSTFKTLAEIQKPEPAEQDFGLQPTDHPKRV